MGAISRGFDPDTIAANLKEAGIQEKQAGVLARTMALSAQNQTSDSYLESFLGNEKIAEIYKEVQNEIEQGKMAERFVPNGENRLGAKMIEERIRELAEIRVNNEHEQQINENQNQTGIPAMPSLTDKQISDIKNVKITDDGQVMVETDSGEANLFDLPLPDDSIDIIANSVKYGDSAKTFFTSFIQGQDPTRYDQNFFKIYYLAGEGFSLEQIRKAYPEAFDGMFPTQIEMAFRSGYYDKRSKVQETHAAIKEKVPQAQETGAKTRTGAVDTSVVDAWMKKTGNRLTKKQKAEIEAGRVIASEIGIDVKYVVNFRDANGKSVGMIDPVTGKITGANGEITFHEKTGKIEMILDINAGLSNFTTKEGQASILRAMSHELTHFIEKMSPRMYQDLQEFIIQNIDFGKDSFHDLVAQKMESLKISEKASIREVIANACETMLGDSDVMTKLYEQNAGLGDRIRNWLSKKIRSIDRAIARIREIFKKAAAGDSAQYAESKALTANLEGYKQALQIWEAALFDAAQNYQNGGLIVLDENVKYSDRESFSEQVDKVLNGTFNKEISHVYVGETPSALTDLGIKKRPMLITANHIYSISVSEQQAKADGKYRKNNHYHELGDLIKKVPEAIQEPALILKSNTDPSNTDIVLVTTLKDNKNRPVIAAIKVDGNGYYNGIDIKTNLVASTYGRNNFNIYLDTAAKENRILFLNKKRSQELLNIPGVQFPNNIQSLDFENSIAQYRASVNNQYMQNSKKNSEHSVKYSEREYSYEELTAKPDMKVTHLKPLHDSDMKKYLKDRNLFVQEMMKRAKQEKNPKNTDTQTYLYCDDLEADILITRDSFRHGAERYGAEYVKICSSISDILKTSIVVNELLPRETTKGGYVLLGLAESENTYNLVRSVVNNKTWKLTDYDVLSAIKKSGIKKEDVEQLNVLRITSNSEGSSPSSIISIANFLEFVKEQNLANSVFSDDVLKIIKENRGSDSLSKNVVYSERPSGRDRKKLAEALENVAQNDEERAIVKEYQEKTVEIRTEYSHLYQLHKELDMYYKQAVKSDQNHLHSLEKQISSLQEKIKEENQKIEVLDSQLLQLKTMRPLRNVLEREKRAAAQEHRKKVFEKEYREKKIRQIQTTVKGINRLLINPDGTKNVKDGLQKESVKFMQTFLNNTSVFNQKQLDRLSEFYKKINSGLYAVPRSCDKQSG